MAKMRVFSGSLQRRKRSAASRILARVASGFSRSSEKSGITRRSRPLTVMTSGWRPRKTVDSSPVIGLTVVKASASRAEALSRDHLAVMFCAAASVAGLMLRRLL